MSLKTDLAKRIIEGMIQKVRRESGDDYVVLVVDAHTSRIISSCCRVYDIMDAGVLVLESLKLNREKLDMSAIYFIEPSEDSIAKFIADFSDKKKPQYTNVHLFFTSHVPDEIMTDLGQCNAAVDDRIKTLLELNCDFLAYESRVFLFDRRGALADLFFPDNSGEPRRKELDTESKQLVSLCLTIGEYPHIRYTGSVRLCLDLAKKVESGLNYLIANLPDWEANKDRERGTLLIVDRSLDPIAPLMHEYTYQAMVNDLLKVKGEVAFIPKKDKSVEREEVKSAVPKGHTGPKMTEQELKDPNAKDGWEEVLLGEDDPLWMEFRHAHIAMVVSIVSKKFNEFKGKNAMANLSSKGQEASVKDMIQAMKAMPQYKTLIRQYYKHLSLADECLSYFHSEYLESVSELEQDMATGLDRDNSPVKAKDIKTKITTTCTSTAINVINKLRLIMIYIISQGAVGHSRKDLWSAAKITLQLEKAILNLKHLGIDLQRKPQASNRDPKRTQLALSATTRIPLALMRFVPILWDVMNSLVSDTLSRDLYPYLKEPPPKDVAKRDASAGVTSTRVKRGWRQGADKNESKESESAKRPGARFIVFMMGGVTFSEIRSAYEIHDDTKAQIYIGSTETLTAQDFIRVLGNFSADQDLKSAAEQGTLETRGAGAGAAARSRDPDEFSDDDLDDDPAPPRSNLAVRNKGRV